MNGMRSSLLVLLMASALVASAAPLVTVSRFPRGMIQEVGGSPPVDDFILINAGSDPASVTINQTGNFFNLSPSSFTLPAGATRTISINTAGMLNGGMYTGTINVSVSGVPQPLSIPVRCLMGSRGQGSVNMSGTAGTPTSGLPGAPHPGSFNVGNSGSTFSTAIITANVPWIVQSTNPITIPAGSSPGIMFTVDPAQRPDGAAPLGAVEGTLRFNYMTGTSNGGAASSQLLLPVVDITKVVVVPDTPAPLAPGETAFFLPGVANGVTDLLLSNRSRDRALTDLRLFFTAAGNTAATAVMARVGQFPPSSSAWFPYGQSSLFNASSQTGTIQLRHPEAVGVALTALKSRVVGNSYYFTPIPVIRSDTSIGPGDRLFFAGVEKSATVQTDVALQETAGFGGSYAIDFFDAGGNPVAPSRNGSLIAFGYANVADAAPSGAQSARVTITSDAGARVNGYANVFDQVTQDWWVVVDSSRRDSQRPDFALIPMPSLTGSPAARFEVFVTNTSDSPVPVTIGRRVPPRGRTVSRRPIAPDPDTVVLAPHATRRITVASAPLGYVPVSAPGGTFTANGRLTVTLPGRIFGTGVPALSLSSAAGLGIVKRFSQVGDLPGFAPTTLFLLEAAGRAATARVTIRFNFPAGSAVSGQGTVSKDYNVAAGQLLTITDVARNILGDQRDSIGIIYNLLIDVEVVAGEGRVLPYVQTTDPTGDITIMVD